MWQSCPRPRFQGTALKTSVLRRCPTLWTLGCVVGNNASSPKKTRRRSAVQSVPSGHCDTGHPARHPPCEFIPSPGAPGRPPGAGPWDGLWLTSLSLRHRAHNARAAPPLCRGVSLVRSPSSTLPFDVDRNAREQEGFVWLHNAPGPVCAPAEARRVLVAEQGCKEVVMGEK